MEPLEAARVHAVLDRLAREKEIAQGFFNSIAERLEDVEHRRWFRRMAQDEKDQRKILVKHLKELCPNPHADARIPISAGHDALAAVTRDTPLDLIDILRLATRAADEARSFADRASDLVGERSCRIFLKILAEEARSHRDELRRTFQEEERRVAAEAEAA